MTKNSEWLLKGRQDEATEISFERDKKKMVKRGKPKKGIYVDDDCFGEKIGMRFGQRPCNISAPIMGYQVCGLHFEHF